MTNADDARSEAIKHAQRASYEYKSDLKAAHAAVAAVWAAIYRADIIRERPEVNDWGI